MGEPQEPRIMGRPRMDKTFEISASAGYHRRGRPGALNDLLWVAGQLIIPAVHSALVDFSVASDRMATHSYSNGVAKLDTYETTIVQEWVRYMASHSAFSLYGLAWESKFLTGRQGRPPAVDIAIEDGRSNAWRRVALIEVKVSEKDLDVAALWKDAKKLWELEADDNGTSVPVEGKLFVVNIVRDLPKDSGLPEFQIVVKQLTDDSKTWTPRFYPVFTAVFPVFQPSPKDGPDPMWIMHGAAVFELQTAD
jgi:hypothetical protein